MIKNYSSYKKTKEVYFGKDLAFPIAVLLIASIITYGVLYFFGFPIAIFFNVIISFCGSFYFYYYGKSITHITLDFLILVTLVLGCFLFFDYGAYALVVYQKTGIFDVIYFQLWLSLLLGIPIVYYVFQYGRYYLKERAMALDYIKVFLIIHHDGELLTYIDTVQFINTSKRTISDVKLEKPNCFYSEEELKKMDENSVRNYLEKSVFSGMIHLPFNANFLFMSWYSIIESKYYDIQLPFSFDKLVIEQEKYPTNVSAVLRGKKTKKLNLHLHTNGGIRLFNTDGVLIDLKESNPTPISLEEENEKLALHRYSHEYYKNPKAFLDLIEKIKDSGGIEERFLIENIKMLWSVNISGLKGNNYLDVFDAAFNEYKAEIAELRIAQVRFLPKEFGIVYRGNYLYDWLTIDINSQELYHSILELTEGDEGIPIEFDLDFENLSETTLKFRITANDKSILFDSWKIQIKKDRKQDMLDHLLDIDEDHQKRSLYKEAWDLVANKQYNQAQEKCDSILSIDPRYGFAYFLEARLIWYKEGFEACYAKKDYFIKRTQHDPAALAHIYNNYGCLYDQQCRYEESLTQFQKAIASNPKEGIYVCNLAEIYCKLSEPQKAMEVAQKAKNGGYQSPTLTAILESKGMSYL